MNTVLKYLWSVCLKNEQNKILFSFWVTMSENDLGNNFIQCITFM